MMNPPHHHPLDTRSFMSVRQLHHLVLFGLLLSLFLSSTFCSAELDVDHQRHARNDHDSTATKSINKTKKTRVEPQRIVPKPLLDPIPLLPKVTHKVFLDIEITPHSNSARSKSTTLDSTLTYKGRIVLGLFGDHAPQLVANFHALCECNPEDIWNQNNVNNKPLCYKGSTFHRVIPNFMIQGGDITHFDGTGGATIYGHDIVDESNSVPLNRKYLLASANRGRRNSNTSQFFITTVKTTWLQYNHVVYGVVLEGFDVVRQIETKGTYSGKPKQSIQIVDTGVLELSEKDKNQRIPVSLEEPFIVKRTSKEA